MNVAESLGFRGTREAEFLDSAFFSCRLTIVVLPASCKERLPREIDKIDSGASLTLGSPPVLARALLMSFNDRSSIGQSSPEGPALRKRRVELANRDDALP